MCLRKQMLLIVLIFFVFLCSFSFAVPPSAYYSDTNGITNFEFYGNGLYFWKTGGNCGGTPVLASIRIISDISITPARVTNLQKSCSLLLGSNNNVVRDTNYAYFCNGSKIKRISLNANESTSPSDLPTAITINNTDGYVPIFYSSVDAKLYWVDYNPSTLANTIYSANTNGSSKTVVFDMTEAGKIKQIMVYYYKVNGYWQKDILVLKDDGKLYLLINNSPIMDLMESDVAYFTVHYYGGKHWCYVLKNPYVPGKKEEKASPSLPPYKGGSIKGYSMTLDESIQLYTTNDKYLTGLAVDDNYVFWSELSGDSAPYSCDIRRMPHGNLTHDAISSISANYAGNVRSNGEMVYFIKSESVGDSIVFVPTNAPPLQFDVKPDYMEITQAIQTVYYNEGARMPLITGKPTFVRGFGYVVRNELAAREFRARARLTGTLNGNPLPGTLYAYLSPPLITSNDMRIRRWDLTKSWNFDIPASWVSQAGTLNLTMDINFDNYLRERVNPPNVLESNSISYTIQIYDVDSLCLVFRPVAYFSGPLWFNPMEIPYFPQMIQRALSLMPTPSISPYFFGGPALRKPQVVLNPFDSNFPGYMKPFDPDQDDWPLILLRLDWMFRTNVPSCPEVHCVGVMHPDVNSTFNGLAFPGPCSLVNLRYSDSVAAYNFPYGGRTIAHEQGHCYWMFHVHSNSTCGSEPDMPYATYPYDGCHIGIDDPLDWSGFDLLTRTVIPPTSAGDLMSYATDRWSSSHYWYGVADALGPVDFKKKKEYPKSKEELDYDTFIQKGEALKNKSGPQIMFCCAINSKDPSGSTGEENKPILTNFYVMPAADIATREFALSALAKEKLSSAVPMYSIKLYNESDVLLQEIALIDDVDVTNITCKTGVHNISIVKIFPYIDGIKKIVLADLATEILTKIISKHAPQVYIGTPQVNYSKQTVTLQWNAYDEDNAKGYTEPTYFTILLSRDDGATWQTMDIDTIAYKIVLDESKIGGSDNCRLKVIATDGFNTSSAISSSFSIRQHAPTVSISGILPNQHIPYGRILNLYGIAYDAEDGSIPDSKLLWDLTGKMSRTVVGNTCMLDNLEPGNYSITFSAKDSDGNQSGYGSLFYVQPVTIPTISAEITIEDGLPGEVSYSNGTTVRVPFGDGSFFTVYLLHSNGFLHIGISDLLLKSGTSSGSFAGIRIDVDGSGDALAQSSDIGFFIDEYGNAIQAKGDGVGNMPVMQNPLDGFSAYVYRGASTWSCEMKIDENIIGGWNHLARIKLGEYWITASGDDRNWPSESVWNSPITWAPAYFGDTAPAPPNSPPVADAGKDQNLEYFPELNVYLNGSASYDLEGSQLKYKWTQKSGPTVTLNNDDTVSPNFIPDAITNKTTYIFELIVNDGEFDSSVDEVTITIDIKSPPLPTPSPTPTPEPTPTGISSNLVAQYLLGVVDLNTEQLQQADANGDSVIDIADVIFLLNSGF